MARPAKLSTEDAVKKLLVDLKELKAVIKRLVVIEKQIAKLKEMNVKTKKDSK